ncbi:hypothetical protein D9619_008272 [Psilocybe cf. subviscida]|uniref:NACHT domain-containing protein n=1 Tax=Psilocybe cf. subviscida TaxID=2480587 RepID=A0A8H5ESQ7_9AGAR|nr:hypothetical protein D9619_008272 [Psilocybe cf. subviscida]
MPFGRLFHPVLIFNPLQAEKGNSPSARRALRALRMAMINLSHSNATFNGGSYTQVNHISQQSHQSVPWDRLQSAAAPSAFHDADDNFDAPKCHPNTRVAVMDELRDFAFRRGDTGSAKILWLSGPAGAGKTAIARSLCEECSVTDSLLASYFFSRSDASRNTHKSFVATIAYQICGRIPPQYQSLVLDVVGRDPLVLTRSVDAQFKALILVPLHDLFESGYFNNTGRRLIVIDGLDECSTAAAQINILTMIQKISTPADFPFIFLVASRPEHEIQAFFRSSSLEFLLHRLTLNDSYLPDVDIERFLRDKFQESFNTHPFKNSISRAWPSSADIQTLVRRSSGLFIYASVVVKYVTSNRHLPSARLDAVLNLRPPKGDLPFGELDKLYSHIFSCVKDLDFALDLISYLAPEVGLQASIADISRINRLNTDNCILALCDLWSIFGIETEYLEKYFIVYHQSIWDYLFDKKRSERNHIDKAQALTAIAKKCLQYISSVKYTAESRNTRYFVISFFDRNLGYLIDNIELCHEALMSFSPIGCYNTFSSLQTRSKEENELFRQMFGHDFFFKFLDRLCDLKGNRYAYIYQHYLDEYRRLTDWHPNVYLSQSGKSVVGLVTALILSEPPGLEMPPKVFQSAAIGPLNNPDTMSNICFKMWADISNLNNLFCYAALRCMEFLVHDIDPSSTAATLRYLTWVLPYASRLFALDAECNMLDPYVFTTTRGYGFRGLARQVSTATQDYRQRYSQGNDSNTHRILDAAT